MALPGGFGVLTPLGLVALASLVPVVVLYLVQPDPRIVSLPTLRFLREDDEQDAANPLLERLRRSLLLFVQLLVLLLLALALATPYVAVSEQTTVEETVLVVDASASMATETDGATRFDRARAAASEDVTGTTSVVVAGSTSQVPLRRGSVADAEETLSSLSVTDAPGSLQSAISEAAALAGENAQVVVYSDFADESAWSGAVESARARGLRVELAQFAGGGSDNVGIVARSFAGQNVSVTVANTGERPAERTVSLGDQRRPLDLEPGDASTVTFRAPAGGGEVRLSPGDSFPTDDVASIAAPPDATVDVLLVTNDRNRYLATALGVVDAVDLTVKQPPTTVEVDYDVVVFSNVHEERLLEGTVQRARDVLADGGGVAIQAQSVMPEVYGDLSLVSPAGIATNPTLGPTADDDLTRGISFPPPSEYVRGDRRGGRALVETADGSPLLATADRDGGRLLYYGYIEDASTFKHNYQYPVFWKRAVFSLAGRDPLPTLNRQTGSRLRFGNETAIETPGGTVSTRSLALDAAGYYTVGGRRIGASLYSAQESAVVAESLTARRAAGDAPARQEERQVPLPLTALVVLAAVAVAVLEVGYLRRRGDL